MTQLMRRRLRIVTGLDDERKALVEESSIERLILTLRRRVDRLITGRETAERLKPLLREFVHYIVEYFNESGAMDEYVMTNVMTALATADAHGEGPHGIEDFSTFIRRLNPTHPDTDGFFVIGRAGRISDPECPLGELEADVDTLSEIPPAQLHMFYAYHHARSLDATRDAPRIPADEFKRLVPGAILRDPVLEEAFLDVCLSDGAWELYQLKLAA
jgi:hypothetical protein